MYELLSQKHAFYGNSLENLAALIRKGNFDKNLPAMYSRELRSICLTCLTSDPANRDPAKIQFGWVI